MRIDSSSESFFYLINEATKISLLVNPIAGDEVLASALGLKLLLEREDKKVAIVYPAAIPTALATLPGAEEVEREMMPRALRLKFRVGTEAVQKVGYYIKDNVFNLIVTPRQGFLEAKELSVSYQSPECDLLILLGYSSWQSLEDSLVGSGYSLDFASLPVVNIDNKIENERFGQVNVVDEAARGISEIIFSSISSWGLKPTYRAAECLLFGLGLLEPPQPSLLKEDLVAAIPGDNYSRSS